MTRSMPLIHAGNISVRCSPYVLFGVAMLVARIIVTREKQGKENTQHMPCTVYECKGTRKKAGCQLYNKKEHCDKDGEL